MTCSCGPACGGDIAHAELPCNFVQIMENSVDPYHIEWLHGRYGSFLKELAGEPPMQVVTKKHVKVVLEVFEHGILKRRVLEGQTEQDEDWKTGHPLVFPGMLRVGIGSASTWAGRISAASCCAGCTSCRWRESRLARIL